MYLIRPYTHKDFAMIDKWWEISTNQHIFEGVMVEDGTFILEIKGVPALCLTTLLTQSKQMAYVSSYIKNPLFKGINLESYGHILWNHCFNYAKDKGYKRILCMAEFEQLKNKYERFGMKRTLNNIATFAKEL